MLGEGDQRLTVEGDQRQAPDIQSLVHLSFSFHSIFDRRTCSPLDDLGSDLRSNRFFMKRKRKGIQGLVEGSQVGFPGAQVLNDRRSHLLFQGSPL